MAKVESYKGLNDEELVHRYRNSHETAYVGELYLRYAHLVFGACLKYLKNQAEAEDATMQIFEKLISDLKRHHIQSFRSWLFTVVKNHCMMEFRKDSTEVKKKTKWNYNQQEIVENPDADHLQEREEREKDKDLVMQNLKEAVNELKDEQRTCIELFYLKNCSYNEISLITGYSIYEVKSYIQNGKRNLKNFIKAKNDQPEG